MRSIYNTTLSFLIPTHFPAILYLKCHCDIDILNFNNPTKSKLFIYNQFPIRMESE